MENSILKEVYNEKEAAEWWYVGDGSEYRLVGHVQVEYLSESYVSNTIIRKSCCAMSKII
tara:strand:- start:1071 stop:1250 length:180 start_codon:yes stop_codon:yes gene_type:complete